MPAPTTVGNIYQSPVINIYHSLVQIRNSQAILFPVLTDEFNKYLCTLLYCNLHKNITKKIMMNTPINKTDKEDCIKTRLKSVFTGTKKSSITKNQNKTWYLAETIPVSSLHSITAPKIYVFNCRMKLHSSGQELGQILMTGILFLCQHWKNWTKISKKVLKSRFHQFSNGIQSGICVSEMINN